MEVSSLTTQSGAAGLSAATSTDTNNTSAITSDFETFLVMLTAQLENQDPLNPMDSSDYAVQLATFSGVEQQVKTNDLLRELSSQTGQSYSLANLASWVGLEAQTDGSAYYSGDPINFSVAVPKTAAWGQLVIKTASGQEVTAVNLTPGSTRAEWDGTWADGTEASNGAYTGELRIYMGGESAPSEIPLQAYGKIVEVRQSGESYEVVLEDGTVLDVDQISTLRSAS